MLVFLKGSVSQGIWRGQQGEAQEVLLIAASWTTITQRSSHYVLDTIQKYKTKKCPMFHCKLSKDRYRETKATTIFHPRRIIQNEF